MSESGEDVGVSLYLVGVDASLFGAILTAFASEAGPMLVTAIHNLLGTDQVYTLSEPYGTRKAAGKVKGFDRMAGKDADQPGILTQALFKGVKFWIDGDSLVAGVDPEVGIAADGSDYAERFERLSEYLEKAFALVEPELDEILNRVVDRVVEAKLSAAGL